MRRAFTILSTVLCTGCGSTAVFLPEPYDGTRCMTVVDHSVRFTETQPQRDEQGKPPTPSLQTWNRTVAYLGSGRDAWDVAQFVREHVCSSVVRTWMKDFIQSRAGGIRREYSAHFAVLLVAGDKAGCLVPEITAWLGSESAQESGDASDCCVTPTTECPRGWSVAARREAIRALQFVEGPESIEALCAALRYPDWRMNLMALWALADLGNRALAAVPSIEHTAAQHWSLSVRIEAKKTLLRLTTPADLPRELVLEHLKAGLPLEAYAFPRSFMWGRYTGPHQPIGRVCPFDSRTGAKNAVWQGTPIVIPALPSETSYGRDPPNGVLEIQGVASPMRVSTESLSASWDVGDGWFLGHFGATPWDPSHFVFLQAQSLQYHCVACTVPRWVGRHQDALMGLWDGDPAGTTQTSSVHEIVRDDGRWVTRFRAVIPGPATHFLVGKDGTIFVGTRQGDVVLPPDGELQALCPSGRLGVQYEPDITHQRML